MPDVPQPSRPNPSGESSVTDSVRVQLQNSLGQAYVVEHELGGGGMSRVFVAMDTALSRRVVVKVLPPEMAAGISTERFRREIQVAAGLQHPNIVPVLSAGDAGGTLYYTMPFVEGETLRGLLTRRGELPVSEAVRLLRGVADALGYAHERGIVHRDIKPENILLTAGHALVADFGIAKALRAAAASDTLTSAGLALGTPAYMAPEQATADPQTDHRADLYALGVVAYELLVGQAPFFGMAPQQMLAAHAVATPEHVTVRRPAVPASLAALVMRLLEKRPADRPQSAAEVLQALDAASSVSSGEDQTASIASATRGKHDRARSVGRMLGAAGLLVAAVAAIGFMMSRRATPTALDGSLIVVAPFRVSGDPSLAYLREGMLDLLAAKLTGEGGPRAGDPRTLLAAWKQRTGEAGGDLSERDAIALARELGAGQLLLGAVVGTADRVSLRASLLDVASGRPRTTTDIEGSTDSLGALVDRLAVDLLARNAGEQERLAGTLASTSLPVLRLYLDGMANGRRGRYPEAQQSWTRALALDSTFTHAAVALVVTNGYHPIDDSTAWAIVDRDSARLHARDLAQIEVRRRFLRGDSYASQLEASRRLIALAPDRAFGWDEMGGSLASFARLTGMPDFRERARTAYTRALELDPQFVSPLRGLLEVSAELGDTAAVRELWPRYQQLAAGALEFDVVRWIVARALADSATLSAVRAQLSSLPPRDLLRMVERMMVSGDGLQDAPAVLRALETNAVDDYDVFRGALATTSFLINAGREPLLPPGFKNAMAGNDAVFNDVDSVLVGMFWDGDSIVTQQAVSRLSARSRGAQSDTEANGRFWTSCVHALWYLTSSDTTAALETLRRARALRDSLAAETRMASVLACLFAGDALLEHARDGSSRVALVRLDSLLTQGFENVQFANLIAARLHESRGDHRSALAAVRRRSNHGRDGPVMLSTMLREEGRLAELTGDRTGAIRAYRHFLALRPDPVARLAPERDRVRQALARLTAGGR